MPPCICDGSSGSSGWTIASSSSSSSVEEEGARPRRRHHHHATARPRAGARPHTGHARRPDPDLAAALAARLASTGLLDNLRAQVRAAAVAALSCEVGPGGAHPPPRPPALAFPHPHAPPGALADALVAQHLAATGRTLTGGVFQSEAGITAGGATGPGGRADAATAAELAAAVGLGGGGGEAVAAWGRRSVLDALTSAACGRGAHPGPRRPAQPTAPSARAALAAVRRELSCGGGGEVRGEGAGPAASSGVAGQDPAAPDALLLSDTTSSDAGGESECTLSLSSEG